MTDPTPPMTLKQRAELVTVGFDLAREGCDESAVIAWTDGRAVFFEGDQLAIVLTLTAERDDARDGEKTARNLMQKAFDVNRKVIAERDAAQAEIARLTAALATAREDGMREGKSLHRIADFIDDQVKVTRETMRQASLGRNDMSLLEIGTSHFLDCARDIRKAAIQKGAAT